MYITRYKEVANFFWVMGMEHKVNAYQGGMVKKITILLLLSLLTAGWGRDCDKPVCLSIENVLDTAYCTNAAFSFQDICEGEGETWFTGSLDIHMANQPGCTYYEGIAEIFDPEMTEVECNAHYGIWFDGNVAGFQFVIKGESMITTGESVTGGSADDADFTFYVEPNWERDINGDDCIDIEGTMIIGFSLDGTSIPPGDTTLATVGFTDYADDVICFEYNDCSSGACINVVNDAYVNSLDVDWNGECNAYDICDDPDNYTYFDQLPETATILDCNFCLTNVDLDVLSDLIEANNLVDDNTALEVGNQTWGEGRLKILMASYNPSGINGVTTQLTILPESFGNLNSLSSLYLAWNSLDSLPESFSQLTNLSSFSINNNWLTELPSDIGNLENLIFLDLGYNKLNTIPPSVCNMANLVYLYLFNNNLTSLPECMCNLNIDWSGQDGGLHPYFASGGNLLCEDEDVPTCIASSSYFESTLDQFYYSVIQDAPQSCCPDVAACNYDEDALDTSNDCEYPGEEGTEYEGECDCDGNIFDCTGEECGGGLIGTGVFECIDQSYSNQVDCVNSGNLWIQIGNDCNGQCGGSAVEDCAGQCGGSAVVDECGECNGDGSSCDPAVYLSITNVDIVDGTLDIYMENTESVAGFQFQLTGINVTDAYGGSAESEGFYLQTEICCVLGFSITGDSVPPGSGVLVTVSFTDYTGGDICFGEDSLYNVVASTVGEELISDWECYTPSPCETFGDVNGDGELNILDVVSLVNCILNSNCTDCTDISQNGVTDVLDLVLLVNIILDPDP